MPDLDTVSSLTWLNTPSDNSHDIGGVLQFSMIEGLQFHIAGKEDGSYKDEGNKIDR